MAVLFDTDTLVIFLRNSNAISAAAKKEIENAGNELAASAATILALKRHLSAVE